MSVSVFSWRTKAGGLVWSDNDFHHQGEYISEPAAHLGRITNVYLTGLLDSGTISQRVCEGNTKFDNISTSFLEREHDIDSVFWLWVSGCDEGHEGRAFYFDVGKVRLDEWPFERH